MKRTREQAEQRARQLLEAWLRGMNQGGHIATPQDIAEVYQIALHDAKAGR